MSNFWCQHWLNLPLLLYVLGLLLLHSLLPLNYEPVRNNPGNLSEWGKIEEEDLGFFFSVEPVPQTISQWQCTCWWWPRAGGSSEKGKGLLKKSEITVLLGVALQPELESVTEKLKHGPLWILKLLTSGMSGLIKFPFRQQWKLPELYFIHSVKYGIQCFNQPEIKSSFQSTELSCRQEIL